MRLEYDPQGDIAYIDVSSDAASVIVDHTERVGSDDEYERGIDYDVNGAVLGYEFMNASRGLNLDGLPHRDEIAAFISRVAGLRILSRAS